MTALNLELKNGKFDFDHALENMDWDKEEFKKALERFANIQAQPFKTELRKQYNEWKQRSEQ
jgi:hypothetical protein